jgi:hypothetical protein
LTNYNSDWLNVLIPKTTDPEIKKTFLYFFELTYHKFDEFCKSRCSSAEQAQIVADIDFGVDALKKLSPQIWNECEFPEAVRRQIVWWEVLPHGDAEF